MGGAWQMATLRTSDPLDGARPFTSDLFFFFFFQSVSAAQLHTCAKQDLHVSFH